MERKKDVVFMESVPLSTELRQSVARVTERSWTGGGGGGEGEPTVMGLPLFPSLSERGHAPIHIPATDAAVTHLRSEGTLPELAASLGFRVPVQDTKTKRSCDFAEVQVSTLGPQSCVCACTRV